MWLPVMLEKYTLLQMQAKGFRLSAEDIYSINQASLKDAVVIFGRGCTGEVVSAKGLLLTNHHCGLEMIQRHSTATNDYLNEGFWAHTAQEELVTPDLTVTFLRQMHDVTEQVLKDVSDTLPETERQRIIDRNSAALIKQTGDTCRFKIDIKPYFHGNQYFMHLYEVFEDVRLVGTPPLAIGKFGGDTDNWMWPRHTGDFCLFRIYADSLNRPAGYSPHNVPYRPARHLSISLKGVKEGDFTMLMGFPGNTSQYAPSHHLAMLRHDLYPPLIALRGQKLDIIKRHMKQSSEIRLKYTAKEATIANSWKRWIGEIKGMDRYRAIAVKQAFEQDFIQWADTLAPPSHRELLHRYEKLYADLTLFRLAESYLLEMIWRNGMELIEFAGAFAQLNHQLKAGETDSTRLADEMNKIAARATQFFKDYHPPIDREMTIALLKSYRATVPEMFHPVTFMHIDKHFKGNMDKYVAYLMQHSQLTTPQKVSQLLAEKPSRLLKALENDPACELYRSFYMVYARQIYPSLTELNRELSQLNRRYMAAQMAMQPQKAFYPDANFTLRVAYGQVMGYRAADAVQYLPGTTIDGIMAKENPDIYDYRVPPRLKELYCNKNYGRYASNGTLPVCFVATNHTTGGNSGSPVLNAHGELIGINFDRAWEGVMSDLMYAPDRSRNIAVDIRYVLWLIDVYAGAGYLVEEMSVVE